MSDYSNELITEIVETVTETHEAFIFETVRPYCEEVIKQKKKTLNAALLLYKNLKEHDAKIRKDAVDAFKQKIMNYVENNGTIPNHFNVDKIAEELKKEKKNE